MKLYSGSSLFEHFEQIMKSINNEINAQTDTYILNVNDDDYAAHIKQRFRINVPHISFDEVYVEVIEREISGSQFPSFEFNISNPDQNFRKEVMIYHIPYSGNIGLLSYRPNPSTMSSGYIAEDAQLKCFLVEVINFYNDPEKIKRDYQDQLRMLNSNYGQVVANCNSFNESLGEYLQRSIAARKVQVWKKNDLIAALGVPIKNKQDVPSTFSVPNPKLKEKIIVKPSVSDSSFTPEPMLDENNYHKILKIINDVGKNFERMPSTYKGKSEEDIRDHILFVVDPNFENGSAGGETFNKSGKTDISLRYDSSVVFVAECKYWKGEAVFLKTIDQLLGYLTWRDSKIAVINFVQNYEFSKVLTKIEGSVQRHPNYLKSLTKKDETWYQYKFHLNGDRNRELELAIISFHLPK